MPKQPDAVTRDETTLGPFYAVEVNYGSGAVAPIEQQAASLPDVLRDLAPISEATGLMSTVAEAPKEDERPDAERPPGEPYQQPSISHLPTESGRLGALKPTPQETKIAEVMQKAKPGKPLSFYVELLRKRANSDGRTSDF